MDYNGITQQQPNLYLHEEHFCIFYVCSCCTPYVNYSESKVGLGPLLKYLISLECLPQTLDTTTSENIPNDFALAIWKSSR